MAAPADGTTLPDAGTKLRMVLDYVPCEACLAHPVGDQDLLCSICARLDRQVAVRVATRTTVLLERPSAAAPVVIPPAGEPVAPAAAALPPAAAARPVVVRFAEDPVAPPGSIDVVVEPLPEPALPLPAPVPVAAPVVAPEPEPEPDFDDIVSFVPARDEFFDYRKPAAVSPLAAPIVRAPEPEPEPASAEPADDFVFRAPEREEPAPAPAPALDEDLIPSEEVPVEAPEVQEQWAPPPQRSEDADAPWRPAPDFLADEEPAPEPVRAPEPIEEPLEAEIVEMEAVEEEVLELEEVVDEPAPEPAPAPAPIEVEEEVLEMEVVEDEPEPAPAPVVAPEPAPQPAPEPEALAPAPAPRAPPAAGGDLYRLRGIDTAAVAALQAAGIAEIAHLSGRDAAELASRTSLPPARVTAWIQVADLASEVGVPLDAANALVAAGVAGPKGLAEADADEIADRVAAFGGASVASRDIKRWKRRA